MSRILFPVLALVLLGAGPASADSGHHQGPPAVSQAWARATPATIKIGAAYVEIKATEHADRLIGASTTMADRVEIHTHDMDGDRMIMAKVDSVEIPAGKTVTFSPGGHHLMLIDLKRQLKAGERLPLVLEFAKAGKVDASAEILPAWALGPGGKKAEDHSQHGADHSQHNMDHSQHGADHSQHKMDHSQHGADHSQHNVEKHSEHHDHDKQHSKH